MPRPRSLTLTTSLFWAFSLLLGLTVGGVLLLDRMLDARRERERSRLLIGAAQDRTEAELRRLLEPIERAALQARGWVQRGEVRRYDEQALMDQFLPQLETLPQSCSMMVSDMSGYEFLLMRNLGPGGLLDTDSDAGVWITRDFRRDAWGLRSRWALWDASGSTCVRRWERELDYDPRGRPWHTGPRELSGQPRVFWTDVDVFFTSKTSGITASLSATDPAGELVVVGYDLLLSDLSAFTQQLQPSPNGKAYVFTDAGELVGLPRGAQGGIESILQPVDEAGLPELAAAQGAWRVRDGGPVPPTLVEAAGESWWIGARPFQISQERRLWIGVAVPEDDLLAAPESSLGLAAIGALGVLLSLGLLLFVTHWFARPLRRLVEQSDRIAALDLSERPPTESVLGEVQQLSDALEAMRRSLAQHEQTILESEAKYRRLIEDLPQSYFFYAHGVDGVFTYISPSINSVLGYSQEEFLTHFTEYMVDSPRNEAANKCTELSIQGIRQPPYLVEIRQRDGAIRILEVLEVPVLDAEGQVVAVEGIAHDVTEALAAEEEHRQAKERAEAATQAKSQFLANMSHEIRTPLHAVLGFAALLSRTDLSDEQRECLDMIQEGGRSLLSLVDEILDFSKVEAGRLVVQSAPFDPRAAVETSLNLLAPRAAAKGLRLTSSVADDVPALLEGDTTRVQQVLVNLLGNAVKFTTRGEVDLRVAVLPRDDEERVWLRFAVRDTGVGIPADELERVFESFSQVDSSATRVHGGTGLGLAISRRLCQAMGGSLDVESQVGVGTTFSFSLPFTPLEDQPAGDPRPAGEPESAPTPCAGLRVLVAEDNRINRTLARRYLEALGCSQVDAVEDGAHALEALLATDYDLVLLDLQMPELDGLEVARRFRDACPDHRPHVIAMTANALSGVREACTEAGMDAYLTKPLELETLRVTLQDLVRA